MNKIFENIGNTLKTITKILFYICLFIGALTFIIGVFRFFVGIDEYTTFAEGLTCTLEDALEYEILYADCYYGRQTANIGIFLMISSIFTLPLYGFGELINLSNQIYLKVKRTENE